MELWQEVCGGDGVEDGEALGGKHGLTATAAAVADEGYFVLHVFAELYEVMFDGLIEQGHALFGVDLTGVAMLDEGLGGAAEGHANVHGRFAGFAEVLHFVAAVAGADAHVLRGPNDFAGALVVHHGERVARGKGPFIHKDAAQLRFATGEEIPDEVLFDVEVLVVELGEEFLVVAVAEAHHGELEESGHGGREDKYLLAAYLHVEEHSAGGEGFEDVLRFGIGLLPGFGCGAHIERLDGEKSDQGCFVFGEEHLKDLEEEFGRRRALGKEVEPVGELLVAIFEGGVGHCVPRRWKNDDRPFYTRTRGKLCDDGCGAKALGQEAVDAALLEELTEFGSESAIRDDLVDFVEVSDVDHGVAAEFGVIGHDDDALGALHHGTKTFEDEGAGFAEAAGGDAADAENGDVCGDAVEHALADGTELDAEAGIEISAGKGDLSLWALPEDLGDRDGVGDDLNGTAEEAAGDFSNGGTAPEDDCLARLNEVCRGAADAYFFLLATYGEAAEVESLFSGEGGHGSAVDTTDGALLLCFDKVASDSGAGDAKTGAQLFETDEVLD